MEDRASGDGACLIAETCQKNRYADWLPATKKSSDSASGCDPYYITTREIKTLA